MDKERPSPLPKGTDANLCSVTGSVEAQDALQKFTSFLETEAEQGHISRSLEKEVLGTCVSTHECCDSPARSD